MAYIGFKKLKGQLARKGVRNPGAVAAYAGIQKYGKKKMRQAAAQHKSLRGVRPYRGK